MMSLQDIGHASPEKPAISIESTQEQKPAVVVNKAKLVRSNDAELLVKNETFHAELPKDTGAFTT
jgi:hypothetical protein